MLRTPVAATLLAILIATAPSAARAEAKIKILSDLPAVVLVDGKAVGKTPLEVDMKYSGHRKVEVRHEKTGLSYVYRVMSPEQGMASRLITSSFAGAAPVSPPIVDQVLLAQAPPPLATPTRTDWKKRQRVRVRNTILGAGLANALFNRGATRHGIFVGLFVLELLNELLHD